jgi:hypothetical protein
MSSSTSKAAAIGGDPRRPADAKRFPRAAMGLDDSAVDTHFLLAMFVGLAGFGLKHKLVAWLAVSMPFHRKPMPRYLKDLSNGSLSQVPH